MINLINSSLVIGGSVVFLLAELEEADEVLPVSESIIPVRRSPAKIHSTKSPTPQKVLL